MTLTQAQRTALHDLYCRLVFDRRANGATHVPSYMTFRRSVLPGPPGCVLVLYAGMWVGIETDGHTHS